MPHRTNKLLSLCRNTHFAALTVQKYTLLSRFSISCQTGFVWGGRLPFSFLDFCDPSPLFKSPTREPQLTGTSRLLVYLFPLCPPSACDGSMFCFFNTYILLTTFSFIAKLPGGGGEGYLLFSFFFSVLLFFSLLQPGVRGVGA